MKRSLILAGFLLAGFGLLAWAADRLPSNTEWEVCVAGPDGLDGTSDDIHIGNLETSGSGDVAQYDDNPSTDHPPNLGETWTDSDEDGVYENGDGDTATFEDNGDGTWDWEKKDARGVVIDRGTMKEVANSPSTPSQP